MTGPRAIHWCSLSASLLTLAAAGCGTDSPPRLELSSLDLSRAAISLETTATLSGQGFFASAVFDLDRDESSLDAEFQVFVGPVALAPEAVSRVNAQTLSLNLPAGLPEGTHDIRVVSPLGQEDQLEGALLVAEPLLSIESAGDGSGSAMETWQLPTGGELTLFALSRWPDGLFFRSEDVSWEVTGDGGSFENAASSLTVTATGPGGLSVAAESPLFGSADAEIQTAECFAPADCPTDPTGCRSATCDAGACGLGAVDKDSDGDGFIDEACGGNDCDDDPASCGSSCFPGNAGADLCDGFDHDCDSATDEDYAATPTNCGVGACTGNTGTLSCVGGVETDSCDPLAGAAASDATCDNTDDDCDAATDEDYASSATSCGVGACAGNAGTLSCVAGVESDSCDPLAGAAGNDATCDNSDDDCDGGTDEDFMLSATICGVGACTGNTGTLSCLLGVESDSCDPLAGAASENQSTGGSCTDTVDNDCDGDTDAADVSCQAGNTPPIAGIVISPAAGDTGTLFNGDGSSSFDLEEATGSLTYDWDWDGDGTFEASGINSTHTFATPGSHEVALRVRDGNGVDDFITFIVVVSDPVDLITVTTAVDENDAGATPGSPGGTGLSLREAIAFADLTAGRQTVLTPPGTDIVSGSLLIPTDAAGMNLVGDGASITGINQDYDCFEITTDGNGVHGFELINCQSGLAINGDSNRVSRITAHGNTRGIELGGDNNLAGPHLESFNNTIMGFDIRGVGNTVRGAIVHDNPVGFEVAINSASFTLLQSEVYGNPEGLRSRGDDGVYRHNTFDANTTSNLEFLSQSTGNEFVNNIVTGSPTGIVATAAAFAELDFSLFSGNTSDCSACTLGGSCLFLDPDYIDSGNDDFRLFGTSPAVDQGDDRGHDLNGPGPGDFSGTAPDMGAHETP